MNEPKTAKQILLSAADIIERRGVSPGNLFRASGGDSLDYYTKDAHCCAIGALLLAADGDDVQAVYSKSNGRYENWLHNIGGVEAVKAAKAVGKTLSSDLPSNLVSCIATWFDRAKPSAEDTAKLFREVAATL